MFNDLYVRSMHIDLCKCLLLVMDIAVTICFCRKWKFPRRESDQRLMGRATPSLWKPSGRNSARARIWKLSWSGAQWFILNSVPSEALSWTKLGRSSPWFQRSLCELTKIPWIFYFLSCPEFLTSTVIHSLGDAHVVFHLGSSTWTVADGWCRNRHHGADFPDVRWLPAITFWQSLAGALGGSFSDLMKKPKVPCWITNPAWWKWCIDGLFPLAVVFFLGGPLAIHPPQECEAMACLASVFAKRFARGLEVCFHKISLFFSLEYGEYILECPWNYSQLLQKFAEVIL